MDEQKKEQLKMIEENKQKLIKLLEKGKVLKNTAELGLAREFIELNDKLEEVIKTIKDIPEVKVPEQQETDLTEINKLLAELTEEIKKKRTTRRNYIFY